MKRETRLLLDKSVDSLLVCIEHFNRPDDRGRVTTVLIQLDHAFEMLLKASIIHRGGRIRDRGALLTIGFEACVRRGLSDGEIKFLTDEQALTLQVINSLRDAAQHHLLDIAEEQLYLHAQSGVTLFGDLLNSVFGRRLIDVVPGRVLPLSTLPLTDLSVLFESEVQQVRALLAPGRRRRTEARARLRPLAILDAAVAGERLQPSDAALDKRGQLLVEGATWTDLFKGAASIHFVADGVGLTLTLRLSKKEGIDVQLVPEGTEGATVVAVRRVDELGFYHLGRNDVADKTGLTRPRTTAMIRYLKLQTDSDCHKRVRVGGIQFDRYSPRAVERIQEALKTGTADAAWAEFGWGKKPPMMLPGE